MVGISYGEVAAVTRCACVVDGRSSLVECCDDVVAATCWDESALHRVAALANSPHIISISHHYIAFVVCLLQTRSI